MILANIAIQKIVLTVTVHHPYRLVIFYPWLIINNLSAFSIHEVDRRFRANSLLRE